MAHGGSAIPSKKKKKKTRTSRAGAVSTGTKITKGGKTTFTSGSFGKQPARSRRTGSATVFSKNILARRAREKKASFESEVAAETIKQSSQLSSEFVNPQGKNLGGGFQRVDPNTPAQVANLRRQQAEREGESEFDQTVADLPRLVEERQLALAETEQALEIPEAEKSFLGFKVEKGKGVLGGDIATPKNLMKAALLGLEIGSLAVGGAAILRGYKAISFLSRRGAALTATRGLSSRTISATARGVTPSAARAAGGRGLQAAKQITTAERGLTLTGTGTRALTTTRAVGAVERGAVGAARESAQLTRALELRLARVQMNPKTAKTALSGLSKFIKGKRNQSLLAGWIGLAMLNGFLDEEADQSIKGAIDDLEFAGETELKQEFMDIRKDMLDKEIWDYAIWLIPFSGVLKYLGAAILDLKAQIKVNELGLAGETKQQIRDEEFRERAKKTEERDQGFRDRESGITEREKAILALAEKNKGVRFV